MASSPDPKAGGQRPPEQAKQGDTVPPLSKTRKSRFPWKTFFHRSATAVFVLGPNGRLRYANPAWETLTVKAFATLRGTRISAKRESASPLWKVLAPPPEAWAGTPIHVRRSRPEFEYGPPWWDLQFVPLKQTQGNAVIGFVTQVGETPEKHAFREPEALATARAELSKWFTLELFAGSNRDVQRISQQLRMAAIVPDPVWILGGPGTGKETAARVIHQLGPRREKPFVALDCKALQPYMIEQFVFGRGGFATGKAVGTLLLKSPDALPRDLQARFVEWRGAKSAPRFICGSDYQWGIGARAHTGIEDFVSQFSTVEISLPTLKWRLDELPRMVERFHIGPCDDEIWAVLRSHHWHMGNLRELRTAMTEAAKNAAGDRIRAEDLPQAIREGKLIADNPPVILRPLAEVMEKAERDTIEMALHLSGWKPAVAAERLSTTRAKLLKRMKALGIKS